MSSHIIRNKQMALRICSCGKSKPSNLERKVYIIIANSGLFYARFHFVTKPKCGLMLLLG